VFKVLACVGVFDIVAGFLVALWTPEGTGFKHGIGTTGGRLMGTGGIFLCAGVAGLWILFERDGGGDYD
jgi:hypothetical protein